MARPGAPCLVETRFSVRRTEGLKVMSEDLERDGENLRVAGWLLAFCFFFD